MGSKHGKLDQKLSQLKIPFKNMIVFFSKTQESKLNNFNLSFQKHLCLH
jgi:cell fate regulator YaaT (PSP1 superfamily)